MPRPCHALATALEQLYPTSCVVCGVRGVKGVCADCLAALPLHPATGCCAICGSIAVEREEASGTADPVCPACRAHPPAFDAARSAAAFRGSVRILVHHLKYRRASWLARPLATCMHGAWVAHFGTLTPDWIVPVPLHPEKRLARTYNQSELLARALSPMLGAPVARSLLSRTRATPTQTRMGKARRLENVRNAFRVPDRARPYVYGRTLLVVDDVMTTGATFQACAQALRQAGAARILCLSFARD